MTTNIIPNISHQSIPLMKTKHILIISILIIIMGGALAVMYFSTETVPYQEYSSTFQQRGDVLTEDRMLKNESDSIYAMQMEIAQFKSETRNELNDNKINWGGVIGSGTAIIMCILGILGIFFSRIDKKREQDNNEIKLSLAQSHFEIKQIVDNNHTETLKKLDENTSQHTSIFKMLEIVEDLTVRKDIRESFRSISRNYMHYQKGNIPEDLQTLITAQAERLIELSDQIMNEHFTFDVYDVAVVKIDEQSKIAWRQIIELFGEEFLPYYKCAQIAALKTFKRKLKAIASDEEFNGKYGRYKRAGEDFLDTIIPLTIEKYKLFLKEKKIVA